ncbi:hypothetical protein EI53_01874 [Fusobacterium naviforme]|nr:hypothetical protein F7P78_06880 [Fusobacterium naviforme]PSL09090.1 hypothetical protein EI53_01874 [Fusobacterium naviforme]STO27726.1 Uncharacterised protein [Fusobacterium naviforme]
MSRKTYYRIAVLIHLIGNILAFSGECALLFVACCLDSEGHEAFMFFIRITAAGALMVAVGALLARIGTGMKLNGRMQIYVTRRY